MRCIVFGQKTFDYMGGISRSIVMVKLSVLPSTHVWLLSLQKKFWPKKIWHLCDSLLSLLTWHHVTSGYSPSHKLCYKGRDFSHVRTLWKKRQQSSGTFQRRSSRSASKSGRGAGKSVCTCQGNILKEIK